MTTAWLMNGVGLLVTTFGAHLIFLYLHKSPKFVDELQNSDLKKAFEKYQRQVMVGIGLLAAWLVVQDIAVIVL